MHFDQTHTAARTGDRTHLDDVDGDAALRGHAGVRPAQLPVEVEDGREEQVIREHRRESLRTSRRAS